MNLEEDNKFNEYGWKSKILFSDGPEYANIIILDKNDKELTVLISKTIEDELTTKCKIYIQEKLYNIIKIDIDENNDFLVIINQSV